LKSTFIYQQILPGDIELIIHLEYILKTYTSEEYCLQGLQLVKKIK